MVAEMVFTSCCLARDYWRDPRCRWQEGERRIGWSGENDLTADLEQKFLLSARPLVCQPLFLEGKRREWG